MRKHTHLVRALAAAVLVAVLAGLPAGAAGAEAKGVRSIRSLALGDSIGFGYMPELEDPWVPEQFVGYPELIGRFTGVGVANLSCPGQTAQAIVDVDAFDTGCFEARAWAASEGIDLLHTDYDGSQLDAALDLIDRGARPLLVTIQGGGNELSFCAEEPEPEQCLGEMLPRITRSLEHAAERISAAARHARVVLVGYHLVPGLEDPLREVNKAIRRAANRAHAIYADAATPFAAYARLHGGDLCAAGLLATYPDGSCDLHPSLIGQRIYAAAVLLAAARGR